MIYCRSRILASTKVKNYCSSGSDKENIKIRTFPGFLSTFKMQFNNYCLRLCRRDKEDITIWTFLYFLGAYIDAIQKLFFQGFWFPQKWRITGSPSHGKLRKRGEELIGGHLHLQDSCTKKLIDANIAINRFFANGFVHT